MYSLSFIICENDIFVYFYVTNLSYLVYRSSEKIGASADRVGDAYVVVFRL